MLEEARGDVETEKSEGIVSLVGRPAANMHRFVCCLLLFAAASVGFGPAAAMPMRPRPRYERAMIAAIEAESELAVCRSAATTEQMRDIVCFETALRKHPYNATWCKQLGGLYLSTAQRRKAMTHFNRSAHIILEAQGFITNRTNSSLGLSPVMMLKLYNVREPLGAVELAKVWLWALTLEHRVVQANETLVDFLLPLDRYRESIDLLRTFADVSAVVRWMPSVRREYKRVRDGGPLALLAEEVLLTTEILAWHWLSSVLTASPTGRVEAQALSRSQCGVGFTEKAEYTVAELVRYVGQCVTTKGKYRDLIQGVGARAADEQYTALLKTPLHQLAASGNENLIRGLTEQHPHTLAAQDNFGRTALHYAVAHQQDRAIVALLKAGTTATAFAKAHGAEGADGAAVGSAIAGAAAKMLRVPDAGGITPLRLACSNSHFRAKFERLVAPFVDDAMNAADGGSVCGSSAMPERIHDETSDEEEERFVGGGGWSGAERRVTADDDASACYFDVRGADSMSHHELIGRYTHASNPVVLRGGLPDAVVKALQRKSLLAKHRNLTLRREPFPTSELYGTAMEGTEPLGAFLERPPQHSVGSVEINPGHVLRSLLDWVPPRLVPEGEGYTTTAETHPLLVLATTGMRTNHVVRNQPTIHAVVYGVTHWRLSPPPTARFSRTRALFNSTDDSQLGCRVQSGDILVVPALWSAAWRSTTESVSFVRRFSWK